MGCLEIAEPNAGQLSLIIDYSLDLPVKAGSEGYHFESALVEGRMWSAGGLLDSTGLDAEILQRWKGYIFSNAMA